MSLKLIATGAPDPDDLGKRLRDIITAAATQISKALRDAAPIVLELDKAGFDYEGFPMRFVRMARKVGHGTLLPEFTTLQHTSLFGYGEKSTTALQESILRDEEVRVIDLENPALENVRRVPFSKLSRNEMRIALCEDGVRPVAQQMIEYRNERQRAAIIPTAIVERVVVKKKKLALNGEFGVSELKRLIKTLEK